MTVETRSTSKGASKPPSSNPKSPPITPKSVIDHIIELCGFPDDSTMKEYIMSQGWSDLSDVVMITLDEVADFKTLNDDGSYKAKPLNHHLRKFKGFLLYYHRLCRNSIHPLDKDDVMMITKADFEAYCLSPDYHSDFQAGITPSKSATVSSMTDELTAAEFRKGVKRDKSHYSNLKDDKHFNSWNRGFVATAHMHHTHLVLDEDYVPRTTTELTLFKEMQVFMYAVFEEHLKTDTGKSLVSKYEATRDAQGIYRELVKHAKSSTAAQLSGDTLLKYITTARYPGNWKGTSYAFVLHWKEQVVHYEKLELEEVPPKQKLRMLQNTVSDIPDLANVKQLSDQIVARGDSPLDYAGYLELLLSACSTYDKKYATARPSGQRSAYNSSLEVAEEVFYDANCTEVFHVDTDVNEIMAYSSNLRSVNQTSSSFIPREEWLKLSQEKRDELIAKRRNERGLQKPPQKGKVTPARRVNVHEQNDVVNIDDIIEYTANAHVSSCLDQDIDEATSNAPDTLLAHMAGRTPSGESAGDIRKVLAAKQTGSGNKNKNLKANETVSVPDTLTVNNTTYYLNKGESISFQGHQYFTHSTMVHYRVGQHECTNMEKALVDRGANGGICGDDMIALEGSERYVDVSGLAGHRENQLRIVTGQALIKTHKGNAIAVFHQMALLGKGKSILSCVQMEHYGAIVEDKSRRLGGKQRILMDGYQIPLDFHNGLPYLPCRPPTPEEVQTLPHIIMTSDIDWDPSIYDNTIDEMDQFYDAEVDEVHHSPFDSQGNYRHRTVATHTILGDPEFFDANEYLDYDDVIDDILDHHQPGMLDQIYEVRTAETKPSKRDYELLRPFFAWAPAATIQRTIQVTTQYARGRVSDTIRQHWKSRFPACNVRRRNEAVATDTVFSDTPAVDSGVTAAQIFIGRSSLVADVYGIKTDKEFVNTLEDNIRERGAMDKLISDCARAETSSRVKDILRALVIADWQSEPYQENQNFAENRYGTIKAATNRVLNRSGAPADCWLLALMYVCYVLNHMASSTLGWIPPLQKLTGQTQDTSALFVCSFYEPVYYDPHYDSFPSSSNEELGHWVGVADHVGDALTFKVLTPSRKVIYRSVIRSALDPSTRHKRLAPLGGETNQVGDKVFIRSNFDTSDLDCPSVARRMPTIDPKSLIGRTFLKETDGDGQRFRARIVRAIIDKENELKNDPQYIKFLCEVDGDTADEIISYNQVLDYIERENLDAENDTEQLYKFRRISAHQGPLRTSDKDYKGSTYNVLIEWETGEVTYEPLDIIAKDDPITCTEYAIRNGLLDTPGWKRFRSIAKREKLLNLSANKAKVHTYRREPFWKFGFLVPRTHAQAIEIDHRNGNTKWQDAEALEMVQLQEYQTFIDKGKGSPTPDGYKKIRCHMVYDVKHDGRHKARLVAGGHLTDPSSESVYSGVVSLRGIRLVTFLAELNHLELWGADVGNAYLEAKTKEKVCIVGGPEFGNLEGHTLVIHKALYGLRTSGLCWHQRFADVLRSMGFTPCKAENDIWMRCANDVYEYLAVYVDDIMIAAHNPEEIVKSLETQHHFKLKGIGSLSYHLGCDYFRDETGTLCFGPRKYIDKMVEQYERMFGSKPKEYTYP